MNELSAKSRFLLPVSECEFVLSNILEDLQPIAFRERKVKDRIERLERLLRLPLGCWLKHIRHKARGCWCSPPDRVPVGPGQS